VSDIVAIDIDLRRIHAVQMRGINPSVVAIDEPDYRNVVRLISLLSTRTVLIELASPMLYSGRIDKKRLAWFIWNVAAATRIVDDLTALRIPVLVAPSSKWTRGYAEEARHKMAQVEYFPDYTKKQNHDLSECQAMIWFYLKAPHDWVTLGDYLAGL
jgi:hypothetical protein